MRPFEQSSLRLLFAAGAVAVASPAFADQPSPALKADIEKVDTQRFEAWKKGDAKRLGSFVDADIRAADGRIANGGMIGKAAFLAAQQAKPAATLSLVPESAPNPNHVPAPTVRVFGADKSVAIVTGLMKDSAKADDKGDLYTAIYARQADGWKLVSYDVTTMGKTYNSVGQTRIPAGASGSLDALTPEARQVAERNRLLLDSMARRIFKNLNDLVGEDVLYIHSEVGGHAESSRKQLIDTKFANPAAAPEIISFSNPVVRFLGANRDVAIMNGIRADATGGASFSTDYKPAWRSVIDQLTVWVRSGPTADDWRIVHLHGAPQMVAK